MEMLELIEIVEEQGQNLTKLYDRYNTLITRVIRLELHVEALGQRVEQMLEQVLISMAPLNGSTQLAQPQKLAEEPEGDSDRNLPAPHQCH